MPKFRRYRKKVKKYNKKKRLNKNQKKFKRGYTKRENKQVDMNQEKRLKAVEQKLKDVKTLYNIRNPVYNSFINALGNSAPVYHDVGVDASVLECYHIINVTPDFILPNYQHDPITGHHTDDEYMQIPGLGGSQIENPHENIETIRLNDNTVFMTKLKPLINWRQFITSTLSTPPDSFPRYPYNMEYINNNGLFKIRLFLIAQPVRQGTDQDMITSIARELPGAKQTFKSAKQRIRMLYTNALVDTSNMSEKLKYKILYDETITPKFKKQYVVNTTTGADEVATSVVYLLSILREPTIFINKKIEFSTAYNVENLNTVANNFTLHWVVKFKDIEQSKFIHDHIQVDTGTNQTQYKNEFNVYVTN